MKLISKRSSKIYGRLSFLNCWQLSYMLWNCSIQIAHQRKKYDSYRLNNIRSPAHFFLQGEAATVRANGEDHAHGVQVYINSPFHLLTKLRTCISAKLGFVKAFYRRRGLGLSHRECARTSAGLPLR